MNITLRILFRPVTAQLPRIFTSIGEDYDERVLPSITTEILKSVVVRTVRSCWVPWVFAQLENLPSSLGSNSQSFSLSLHMLAQLRVCQPGENGLNSGAHGFTDRLGMDNLSLLELPSHCCLSRFQARFDAGELITQRELVSRQVSEDLTERAATFGLILDDVSLVRVLPFQLFLSAVCASQSSGNTVDDTWTVFVCLWDFAVPAQGSASGFVTGRL